MCAVERERQRLSFGQVADLYDLARPSYPGDLIDDVIAFAGGARLGPGRGRALEVGAGTGKATVSFAERGIEVTALEPSPEMAAIARRNCAPFAQVTVHETDLEHWAMENGAFALVYAAQAWHWVTPELKYVLARQALGDGGALAAFWNRPVWDLAPPKLRDDLTAAYREIAPDLGPDPGPEDPAVTVPSDRWEAWQAEIDAAAGFSDPEVRLYNWVRDYTPAEYVALLSTHSDHVLLPDDRRAQLMSAVTDVIEAHGGTLELNYVTRLCLARATP